ncbi:MAG: hypothetical protein Q8R70_05715, partial [Methanoregula sp.]|nr:hypothetical protein [Methanoregula sp.]
ASLPLPSLLLPCGFHLLPERVISCVNLSIDKYFGRNTIFTHRMVANNHFGSVIMARFDQKRIIGKNISEMRNPAISPLILLNRIFWTNMPIPLQSFSSTEQHMRHVNILPASRQISSGRQHLSSITSPVTL